MPSTTPPRRPLFEGLPAAPLPNRRQALGQAGAFLACSWLAAGPVKANEVARRPRVRELHSFKFKGQPRHGGARPQAGLIRASDGLLYGTAYAGGPGEVGTVYRVLQADKVQTVHAFAWGDGGPSFPTTPLVQASDGALYGASSSGGEVGWGTLYRVTMTGQVQVLHSLGPGTGHQASAGLTPAADGHLYGVLPSGGTWGHGTVFRLTLDGEFEVLHAFHGPTEGAFPGHPLVVGPDGHLYGTASTMEFTTVFRVTLAGQFSLVRTLSVSEGRGGGQLVSANGFLYGTTIFGGVEDNGSFYRLRPDGSGFEVLRQFPSPYAQTGRRPSGPLMRASDGRFYCVSSPYGDAPVLMQLTARGRSRVLAAYPERCGPAGTLLEWDGRALLGVTEYGGAWGHGNLYAVSA